MSDNDELINTNVQFSTGETSIKETVQLMVEQKSSCILVTDENDHVCGIVTERDIVRKFTLLDVEDKLERKTSAFMSRPVNFVKLKDMFDTVVKLHFDKKVRHFPICNEDEPHKDNILGMISVTDLLKTILMKKGDTSEVTDKAANIEVKFGVLAKSEKFYQDYYTIFSKLHHQVTRINDFPKFIQKVIKDPIPILFDMDGYQQAELKELIAVTKKYPGNLIMATSNPAIVPLFRKFLDKERQVIAIKPIDITYINWLLTERWYQEKEEATEPDKAG